MIEWLKAKNRKIIFSLAKSKAIITAVITLAVFSVATLQVSANNLAADSPYGRILLEYGQYFSPRDMFGNAIRWLGWYTMVGVFRIVYFLEGLLTGALEFFGFVEFLQTHSIYTSMLSGLIAVLMAATLSWIGLKAVINQGEVPKFKHVAQNMVVAIILIVGTPHLMIWLQEGVDIIWGVGDSSNSTEISLATVQQNVTDLEPALRQDLEWDSYFSQSQKNYITSVDSIGHLDPLEFYPPSRSNFFGVESRVFDTESARILDWSLGVESNDNGSYEQVVYDMEDEDGPGFWARRMGDTFEVGYYRLTWNWFTIVFTLGALAVAYTFVIFSIATIYFELGFKMIFSGIVMATDLETGQKTKMIVQDIIRGFMTVAFEVIGFRIFSLFTGWLVSSDLNIVLYLVGLTAATMGLIKGSSTLMTYFGVDTGLSEGRSEFSRFAKWTGLKALAGGAFKAGKGGLNKIKGNKDSGNGGDNFDRSALETSNQTSGVPDINDSQRDNNQERIAGKRSMANGVRKASEMAGYVSERGLGGSVKDAAAHTANELKDKAAKAGENTIEGAKDLVKSASDRSIMPIARSVTGVAAAATAGYAAGRLSGMGASDEEDVDPFPKSKNASEHTDSASVEGNLQSTEEALRKVRTELEDIDFSDPEEATRRVNEILSNESMDEESKKTLREEISKANEMEPSEAQQHIKQVIDKAMSETETEAISGTTNVSPANTVPVTDSKPNAQSVTSQGLSGNTQNSEQAQNVTQTNHTPGSSVSAAPKLQGASVDAIPSVALQPLRTAASSLSRVEGGTSDEKIQSVKQAVMESAKQPEIVEQTVKQVVSQSALNIPSDVQSSITQEVKAIRTEATKAGLSDETVQQRVVRSIEPMLSAVPDDQKQQIVREIKEASVGSTAGTNRVIQQLDSANIATPKQVNQNVVRSFTKTSEPLAGAVQSQVRTIISEAKQQSNSPEDIVQTVRQRVSSEVDFGNQNHLKQEVISNLNTANQPTQQQVQANIKQVVAVNRSESTTDVYKQAENDLKVRERKEKFNSRIGSTPSDYSVFKAQKL